MHECTARFHLNYIRHDLLLTYMYRAELLDGAVQKSIKPAMTLSSVSSYQGIGC
jgi:hypothetical protein